DVAVAHHDGAPLERGPDHLLDVLGPVGGVEQRLGPRRQAALGRVEQDGAEPHADLGGAGLAGLYDVLPLVAQPDGEHPGLAGRARTWRAPPAVRTRSGGVGTPERSASWRRPSTSPTAASTGPGSSTRLVPVIW